MADTLAVEGVCTVKKRSAVPGKSRVKVARTQPRWAITLVLREMEAAACARAGAASRRAASMDMVQEPELPLAE